MRGWTLLLGAIVAGVALYYYEHKTLVVGVQKSTALATVVGANGSCVMNADGTSECMTDPDSDIDAGLPVSPQVQTEAAYNANVGSGNELTIGGNSQQTDFSAFADPSEVLQ